MPISSAALGMSPKPTISDSLSVQGRDFGGVGSAVGVAPASAGAAATACAAAWASTTFDARQRASHAAARARASRRVSDCPGVSTGSRGGPRGRTARCSGNAGCEEDRLRSSAVCICYAYVGRPFRWPLDCSEPRAHVS